MFLVLSKFIPLEPGAKYLIKSEINDILSKNNINYDNTPIIDPKYYDQAIFEAWVAAVNTYIEQIGSLIFFYEKFVDNSTDTTITFQMMADKNLYMNFLNSPEHQDFLNSRAVFLNLIKVGIEVKNLETEEFMDLNSFDQVNTLFNSITP